MARTVSVSIPAARAWVASTAAVARTAASSGTSRVPVTTVPVRRRLATSPAASSSA